MSPAEIATAILLICGNGGTDKEFNCYDHYNNCVINRTLNPSLKDFEACKETERTGMEKMKKLSEEK